MNAIDTIRAEFGAAVAAWVDKNSAGWVIEMLADTSVNKRGPMAGRRVCDCFAEKHAANIPGLAAALAARSLRAAA